MRPAIGIGRAIGSSVRRGMARRFAMNAALVTIARRYGTLIGVAAILFYFWISLPGTFLTGRNLLNISQQMSMLAVVAFAMTVVMAIGDFDLSVGSTASLAGVVAALVFLGGGPTAL